MREPLALQAAPAHYAGARKAIRVRVRDALGVRWLDRVESYALRTAQLALTEGAARRGFLVASPFAPCHAVYRMGACEATANGCGEGEARPSSGRCSIGLFCGAIWILHREIHQFHTGDVIRHLRAIPAPNMALALLLTALSYLALTGYDALACRYVNVRLGYPRIALTSFVAYVFSHNVGLALFGGSAVRYRMLSSFGLKPGEIARIIVFNVVTFWLGFAAIGGGALAFEPSKLPTGWLSTFSRTDRDHAPLAASGVPGRARGGASRSMVRSGVVAGHARGRARSRSRSPTGRSPRRCSTPSCRTRRGSLSRSCSAPTCWPWCSASFRACRGDSASSIRPWSSCWAASFRATSCWPACSRTGSSTTSCRWPSRSCCSAGFELLQRARRSQTRARAPLGLGTGAGAPEFRGDRVSRGRRAAGVGRDAGCAAPPRSPAGLAAASPARGLALPRLRDRCRPAAPGARAAAAARRRLLRRPRAARRRSRRVALEGVRLGEASLLTAWF